MSLEKSLLALDQRLPSWGGSLGEMLENPCSFLPLLALHPKYLWTCKWIFADPDPQILLFFI